MQVSNLVFYAQSSGSKTGLVWAEGHSYVTLTDPLGGRGDSDSYVTLTDPLGGRGDSYVTLTDPLGGRSDSYVTLTDPLGRRGDSYVTLTDVGFLPIHVEIWMSLGVSHQAG